MLTTPKIYVNLTPETAPQVFPIFRACLVRVQNWIAENLLKLTPDKTFIVFGKPSEKAELSSELAGLTTFTGRKGQKPRGNI
jgi:hypothetical protein